MSPDMSADSPTDAYFDFRDDAGKWDPDTTSKVLRRYHQLLWSAPLPIGDWVAADISDSGPS